MTDDLLGRLINNQFRVDTYVNFQGSGFVYEVQNLEDDTTLVMRLLPPSYENDPSFYKEVVRKANALSKLSHPNIVPFYGLYKDQAKDFSFSLEKHIDGSSLDQLLGEKDGEGGKALSVPSPKNDAPPRDQGKPSNKERKLLPLQEALSIMKAISAALAYAHSSGVVHGDIKPENVIISNRGNIYLTGFKIAPSLASAAAQSDHQPAHTDSNTIPGDSAAPEQDIYAEGALLFEILTGERLFLLPGGESENRSAKLARRIRQAQLSIPQSNPRYAIADIYDELGEVIDKALKSNPAERYHSAREFFLAICKAVRIFDSEIPDQLWAKIPVTGAAAVSWPRFPRISPAAAAIAGAVVCVLILGGYLFFSGFFSLRQSLKVLPGYAYVEDGEVTNQVPGGQATVYKKGASISTGPGSLITVGSGLTTLLLPGEYRLKIAGGPVTSFELVEETSNQNTHTVVELHQGSLFLISNDRSDKNKPVYIQTVSGRSTLFGSIMGNRYDNATQTFSVDCVQGQCLLEAEDSVNLTSGQRSQVDSSGKPVPPSLMNLKLYSEYNLDFIPTELLTQNETPSALSVLPPATPTPHPTIQFTPTQIPPTWTPSPTATPVTGYGH